MSALPLIADEQRTFRDVGLVPNADIRQTPQTAYFPQFTTPLGGVDLKRLAFGCVLERQTLGWFGSRVLDGVNHVGHFHERLTCLEYLRRLAFHFHGDGPLQHVNKPWCRMSMPAGIRTRCPIGNPHIHLAALDIGQIHFEKVGSLDRLLLGIGRPTTNSGNRDSSHQREKWQSDHSLH